MKRAASLILFLLLCITNVYAKIEDGIAFGSYNVPAKERTSLCVPGSQHGWIAFSDSLTVSFSVKENLNIGRFGYICRMLTDNYQPMDILLSPVDNKSRICATADHRYVVQVFDQDEDMSEWRDIYLRIYSRNDSLIFTANGKEVLRVEDRHKRHKARMVFGKVDIPGFITSDVAPMILADLQIRRDARKVASWMLSSQADLRPSRGIDIKAVNPVFSRDLNIYWKKVFSADVPSVTYCCFSPDKSRVFFISEGQIMEFDTHSSSATKRIVSTDIKNSCVLDLFDVLPDGTIVCADAPRGEFIRFNSEKGDWESPVGRTRISTTLHHNSVCAGGKYYQLFGYGQHRYSNTAWIWDPASFETSAVEISGAAPRYLAGAGQRDGKIYVLGGKGNESGRQELGVMLFDSCLEIDPRSMSAQTLWSNPLLKENTVASDLVFVDDGLYALLYNPEIHDSALRLTRFDPLSGEHQNLSDPVPYPFRDITSQARLAFDGSIESFVAAVCYQDDNSANKADVYTLSYPVLPVPGKRSGGLPVWIYLLMTVFAAAILLAAILLFRRKPARDVSGSDIPEITQEPLKPGIYFLGGLHVRDGNGVDIASSFSPTLLQFLAILVLYSAQKGGVSNAKLKSILWPDKTDESFNNNKGVYLRRLRDVLKQIGPITIVQDGSLWRIEEGTDFFDYLVAKKWLEEGDNARILRVASWGPLLPEYQFDWLDPFKAEYTDMILSTLSSIHESGVSPDTSVKIADCRLLFDSLDEDAVRQKCQALITLGRAGTAKSVFERFTVDYQKVMGENFTKDFPSFIKKNSH